MKRSNLIKGIVCELVKRFQFLIGKVQHKYYHIGEELPICHVSISRRYGTTFKFNGPYIVETDSGKTSVTFQFLIGTVQHNMQRRIYLWQLLESFNSS